MVRMVWLLLLLLSATANATFAEDRFTVHLDKQSLVLGEPLALEIRARSTGEPLDSITLDKLKQDFDIYAISSSKQTEKRQGHEVVAEVLTATLYPLHSGNLHLPSFTYGGTSSKPLQVTVLKSAPDGSPILIKARIDPDRARVRQGIMLYLDIYDDGSLQWSPVRNVTAPGVYFQPLAETQAEETLAGARYTLHRYRWSVLPLREGGVTLHFPMLDAVKFGTHLRYAVAPLHFEVEPVPAYLPVHVPVGKPNLSAQPLPHVMVLNRPVDWILTVQGTGLSEAGLTKLLSVLRSNDSVRFYPPAISHVEHEKDASPEQQFRVVLPFEALRAGPQQLPSFNLPYYDLTSKRIEALHLAGPTIEVVNPLRQTLQRILLGVVTAGAAIGLGYLLHKYARRLQRRKRSLRAVKRARTPDELSRALLAVDLGYGVPEAATLRQWLDGMKRFYHLSHAPLDEIVQVLEGVRYGPGLARSTIAELADEAARLLKKIKRKKFGEPKETHDQSYSSRFNMEK